MTLAASPTCGDCLLQVVEQTRHHPYKLAIIPTYRLRYLSPKKRHLIQKSVLLAQHERVRHMLDLLTEDTVICIDYVHAQAAIRARWYGMTHLPSFDSILKTPRCWRPLKQI